ncbi:MAG: hypothetical protein IJN34_05350 [Clostridia bacterium]|nr:hypothetical protein [Clostridia bacterium]
MKKLAILLIICLSLSAFAGCARANESGEEMATLTQPEQTVEKDEVGEQKEPVDIDSAEVSEEESDETVEQKEPNDIDLTVEPDTDEPNRLNWGVKDNVNQLNSNELTNQTNSGEKESDKHQIVYGNVPVGAQYELSSLPRFADRCVGVQNLSGDNITLENMRTKLDPSQSIVFRGKVNGKSTQYRRNGSGRQYNETPVLVQEVYYGDLKVGDVVNCYENMFVHLHDGEPVLEHYGVWPPLEKDEEYLFILRDGEPMHEGGDDVYYVGHSYEPYIRISELGTLQSKKELSKKEQRNLDALTYYYLGQRGEEK